MQDTKQAWERFETDFKALGAQFKHRYEESADSVDKAAVHDSVAKLRDAADGVFRALDRAARDPEVRADTQQAARSFGLALSETFRQISEELGDAFRKPEEPPRG